MAARSLQVLGMPWGRVCKPLVLILIRAPSAFPECCRLALSPNSPPTYVRLAAQEHELPPLRGGML